MNRTINFKYTACQEVTGTNPVDDTKLILCGRQGAHVIWHNRDGKHVYIMCDACADHSVKNRRAIELVPKELKND